ncbi:MAG: HD domain-containing protein [Gammaproteobacteria bacterium]
MKKKADIEKRAAALYDDRLPYHNFDHVMRVLAAGKELMEKCRRGNIPFDEEAVHYAILLHDAGFHEDHVALGFDSKEAYSADLARDLLNELAVPKSVIDKVVSAILCTHVDGYCRTVEDKIVRQADISGMGSDYEQFREDAVNLKQELELLSGKQISWEEWKTQAKERINLYLREDTGLVSKDYDAHGAPVFHNRVRENLKAMMSDETLSR